MPAFGGYSTRIGVISYCAKDQKDWYGLHFYGFGDSALPQVEWQPSYGFAARPMDAGSDGIGCNGFYSLAGEFAYTGHDPRYNDKCPPLTSGSSAHWNYKGAFSLLDAETDTWMLYVPRSGGTRAHAVNVGQNSNGGEYIELRHANGAYLTITETSAVLRYTGNALVEVLGDAINLNGKVNTTASLTVGGTAAQSLPLMPQLLAYMTALETLLTAIAADVALRTPNPSGAPSPGPAALALTAFTGAVSALKTAMASQMLKGL